ncbi:single-stranded DNA-binding protein [Microbacterium esteraromaticum]|uniref:single-stranded DNA-binding protein n=1 Tax=Microbacterium esteraromaticum TaxID=57043 RepID=UPI00309D0EC7
MTENITIHGGLTSAPELRYSQNGLPIVSGTVASTERYLDKQTNEWRDGKKLFLRFSAFKDTAENIAASNLDKGAQVVVSGKLHTREYEDREGVKRTSTELEVTDFAVSLRYATAAVTRASRAEGGQASRGRTETASSDGWSTAQPGGTQSNAWSTPGSFGDDTPF